MSVKSDSQRTQSDLLKTLLSDMDRIAHATHHDPAAVLGRLPGNPHKHILFYSPDTLELRLGDFKAAVPRIPDSDFFIYDGELDTLPEHYLLHRIDQQNNHHKYYDPYSFAAQISDYDLHLFAEGRHFHIYNILGAHKKEINGINGVHFATWAPSAERVSIIGDFNGWDGRCHPMMSRGSNGIWELFIPGLDNNALYKFEIRNRDSGEILSKTDPYAQQMEMRPRTASVINEKSSFQWQDEQWLTQRKEYDWLHAPMSIYECHPGSWQRDKDNQFLNYRELAHRLVDYVKETGFTHIELMPITEHPLDASWGYQTTGYFAPTRRFGTADDFRYFVNHCHRHGIGVLLDWVPAHFPKDEHGLARFDGSALYEHEDPRRGEHRDWGTLIYNYGRNEVKNFLIANALFWIGEFHIDGLRVDAVASMLYLDYSREENDWIPNQHGGNENLEAIAFMRELNTATHEYHPGSIIMAEESTAWPQVTRPVDIGGLGFSMKWNMGWMHDSLTYMRKDPVHRHYHHDKLTFGLLYLFTENFILPFSHDEVVHGKGSMLNKMPGDEWQRFANLRLLYTYMFTYPGKKLLFMGCEFGQPGEWNHDKGLEWDVLQYPLHSGIKQLVTDLNRLYTQQPALHYFDFDHDGFEWISCNDTDQSVLAYLRKDETETIIVILNFTPVVRHGYRVGVPIAGEYEVLFNSDSHHYAGSNAGSDAVIVADNSGWMERPASLTLDLPPLAALVLIKK
ncbi:MAG: 1,4-alpha-glucan branching protein GlgB [Gammaproteobacteria bacterium]|nr:1,4-alpha-glucan branching protein GlgB [Gammaproteobacteria bacterium]